MKKDALRGFVFYTQDYFGDVAVRLMPANLRMVWTEAFFLMDQSPRRGVLLKKNGEPYSVRELATAINTTVEDVESAIAMVLKEGIASVDGRTKALMCRRMVREEKRRKINTKNAQKGGNPALVSKSHDKASGMSDNRNSNRPVIPKPDPDPDPELKRLIKDDSIPPHSSAGADNAPKYTKDFEQFWERSTKRGSKFDAFKAWRKIKPAIELMELILAGMFRWKQSEQWQDERLQPHISTWLNRRGWDEIVPGGKGKNYSQDELEAAEQRHRTIYQGKLR